MCEQCGCHNHDHDHHDAHHHHDGHSHDHHDGHHHHDGHSHDHHDGHHHHDGHDHGDNPDSQAMQQRNTIIAVCGKGGVGKTSLTTLITKMLCERGDGNVLAIDADPAVGLATSLGIQVERTLDDIRNDLIGRVKQGLRQDRREVINQLEYELLEAVSEREGLAFLAIGRPESDGCYCQINDLLKDLISSLSRNFRYVVIDGEAGVEQVNRRVMEQVTHLILVSDASAKGINVVRTIKTVSDRAVRYDQVGLILNRIHGPEEFDRIGLPEEIPLLGWVPEDTQIREYDREEKSLLDLPDDAAVQAVRECVARLVMS